MAAPAAGVLMAVLIIGSVAAMIRLPDSGRYHFWVALLLAILPFTAAGVAISAVFQQHAGGSSWLYGADLLGAAAAALTVVPSLEAFGPTTTVSMASAVAGLGALLLAGSQTRIRTLASVAFVAPAAVFALLAGFRVQLAVPIANDPAKEMYQLVNDPSFQASIVESRWGAFGRTDVVRSELRPNQLMLFVDGAAGSVMYRPDAVFNDPTERARLLLSYGGYLPLRLLPDDRKRDALVIGAGAGRDVLLALTAGVERITAVEVNPEIVAIVRDYREFNGGLYSGHPNVSVVVAEGRTFVANAASSYDVIVLGLPVTKSSRSVDGYALTETYLFTVEAFGEYLDHLTPGGSIIAVMHNDAEIYRLLALATAAFGRRGVAERDVMRRIYTIPAAPAPALVVQKAPLTVAEADAIRHGIQALGLDRRPFYVPRQPGQPASAEQDGRGRPATDERLVKVAEGTTTLAALAGDAAYDVSPVSDDRPFFFNLERGLPGPFGAFAVLILGGLLCLARWGFALLPRPRARPERLPLPRLLLVFSLLGAGYMLVEISLFHRMMLFVGQPQKALTLLLFGLLLGGGLGSLASAGIHRGMAKTAAIVCLAVAVTTSLVAVCFGRLTAVGLPPQATALLALLPLGFLLGFPFPLAARLADALGLADRVTALWGVNGVASVLGSALAMMVGLVLGFTWSLALGAAIYGLVALLLMGFSGAGSQASGRVSPAKDS